MKAINRNKNSPTSQIRIYTGNILKWMICNKRFFKLLFFISLTLICLKCGTAPFLIIILYVLRVILKLVFYMIITVFVIIITFLLFYSNFINQLIINQVNINNKYCCFWVILKDFIFRMMDSLFCPKGLLSMITPERSKGRLSTAMVSAGCFFFLVQILLSSPSCHGMDCQFFALAAYV